MVPHTVVEIVEWDKIGRGIGRYVCPNGNSSSIACPGGIVGEVVQVEAVRKNPKSPPRFEARQFSIVTASPFRTSPLCPHVGLCGGCIWQHITYEHQLHIKYQWIEQLLTSLGTVSYVLRPMIGSEVPWRYRNKMEFSFFDDVAGRHFLGLFQCQRRRCVFDVDVCYLSGEWVVKTLAAVRLWWIASGLTAYRPLTNTGSLLTVTMKESETMGDRMVILTVSGNPDFALKRYHLDSFIEAVQRVAMPEKGSISILLRIRQIAKKMPTQIYEMMLHGPDCIKERLDVEIKPGIKKSLEFHISPQSFFQPNTRQSMRIYSLALQMANLQSSDVVFDLYCGIGIFGMFAALEVRSVVGVEISRDSSYDAKVNAERLGLKNFSIQCGDIAVVIDRMKKGGIYERPSVVIVDPPRAGLMRGAIERIESLQPRAIVYVSCNPVTQVNDVKELIDRGWQVQIVQPLDQFPHTFHVENIMLLVNKTYV